MPSVRRPLCAIVLFALWLVTAQTAAAQTLGDLDSSYRDWMKRHHIQRGQLAVVYDHRLVFTRGYGGAQPNQPVLLASLSKSITGLCIARLVDGGRLTFETRIGDVLAPYFRTFGEPADPRIKQATIGQLLAQRSGYDGKDSDPASGPKTLPRYLASYPVSLPAMDRLLSAALRQPMARLPGETYAYTNLGYLMLGVVIEQVTKQPYERYCQSTVLKPLGIDAALDPTWSVLGSFAGWRMSGPQYLRVMDAFRAKSPVLGPKGRAFFLDPTDKWMTDSQDVYYALGMVVRPLKEGGLNLAHPGEWRYIFNSRANPGLAESVGTYAVSYAKNGSLFAEFRPYPDEAAVIELDRIVGKGMEAVTRWPTEDAYTTAGTK